MADATGAKLGRKFYFANLPTGAILKKPTAPIKAWWICEQTHRQMKEELGLDPFVSRSGTGCTDTGR